MLVFAYKIIKVKSKLSKNRLRSILYFILARFNMKYKIFVNYFLTIS